MTWGSLNCSWFPVEQVEPRGQVGLVAGRPRHSEHRLCGAACSRFRVKGCNNAGLPCSHSSSARVLQPFQVLVSSEGLFLEFCECFPLAAALRALCWAPGGSQPPGRSGVLPSLSAKHSVTRTEGNVLPLHTMMHFNTN